LHGAQLLHGCVMVAWFADGVTVQFGRLVGSDNNGIGVSSRHIVGL
jgi:hypothetical protein